MMTRTRFFIGVAGWIGPITFFILFLLALVLLNQTAPAEAGIMSDSEAALANDYAAQPEGLDAGGWDWWPGSVSGGFCDLWWWVRKTIYVLPVLL